jgi:hypothetical protein
MLRRATMDANVQPRYGDFPGLFWDARPDDPIDATNPVVLARMLTRGSMDALEQLVSPDELRRALLRLIVEEHVRRFGMRVLEQMPPARQ